MQDNQTLVENSNTSNINMTWDFEHPEFPEPVICMFYNPDFIIYSSLGSFYIPCLIMVVLYTRIFKVEPLTESRSHLVPQTLHARAQQKSRPGMSLGCLPSATAIQPAALCRKVSCHNTCRVKLN